MNNSERIKVLAEEATSLINEFQKDTSIVIDSKFSKVYSSKSGETIIVETIEGEELEYILSKISCIFREEFEGISPSANNFFYKLEIAKLDAESKISKIGKDDYVNYMGNLCYAEQRGENIYRRLKEIEKEVEKLRIN